MFQLIYYEIQIALDEFTSLLGEAEARGLLELLRLATAGRVGARNGPSVITAVLLGINTHFRIVWYYKFFV